MRAVLQRVDRAAVSVDGVTVGECGYGMLILLGINVDDSEVDADVLCHSLLAAGHTTTNQLEEADCILMAHDNEELVRLQDANDYSRSLSIASDTPAAEKLAWWLKEHGWTKGCVIFVGALPVIPAGYLAYRYGKFVLDVASKV